MPTDYPTISNSIGKVITFIMPGLMDSHSWDFLQHDALTTMKKLTGLLAKSKKVAIGDLEQWILKHYQLPEDYGNCARFMAKGEGLINASDGDENYWLRADPVMLTASHNGILCRGNRLLNLTEAERDSIMLLVNDYFKEQPIELMLSNSRQGYLRTSEPINCQFISLAKVMGQDISHRLPVGDKAHYWHQILTELQMLLHRSEVNQRRIDEGLPVVSGLWP